MEDDLKAESVVSPAPEEPGPPDYRPPPFTTADGRNITYLHGEIPYTQYILSSNVFDAGHAGGCKYIYEPGPLRKALYSLNSTKDANRRIIIQGEAAKDTFEEVYLYQEHTYHNTMDHISMHRPWKVVRKGESIPMFELRLGDGEGVLHMLRHPREANRRILWHDNNENIVAVEHRPEYTWLFRQRSSLEEAMEQTKPGFSTLDEIKHMPTLEILVELGDRMYDLIVAVWMARLFQEAMWLHPTPMRRRLSGNWS